MGLSCVACRGGSVVWVGVVGTVNDLARTAWIGGTDSDTGHSCPRC